MEIINTSVADGRISAVGYWQKKLYRWVEIVFSHKKPKRNNAAHQQNDLCNLQGYIWGKNIINRQKKIQDRGKMHRKMRKKLVSLTCWKRLKALLKIVINIAKNSEIKVRRGINKQTENDDCRYKNRRNNGYTYSCCQACLRRNVNFKKNEEKRLTSETLFPLSIGYKQKKAVTK